MAEQTAEYIALSNRGTVTGPQLKPTIADGNKCL